jgi:transposase-like protein
MQYGSQKKKLICVRVWNYTKMQTTFQLFIFFTNLQQTDLFEIKVKNQIPVIHTIVSNWVLYVAMVCVFVFSDVICSLTHSH